MATFSNTSSYWDTQQEYHFRQWKNQLSAAFIAAGFVKTADTGQIAGSLQTPIGYALYNGTSLTLAGWQNAFDQNTATTWSTGLTPTAGVLPSTLYVVWDSGSLVSPTAATYKVYFQGAVGDPAAWTLQGSTDNVSWTTLDTQTALSFTVGYQTFTIASPAAFRWYRLAITNVRGTTNALVFADWQLMTSAPANIIAYTPAFTSTTGGSTVIGYEVYRFADTLQSTVPCFFKVEYGVGGNNGMPGLWITLGSASDGAGNIQGLGITTRQTITGVSTPSAINSLVPAAKTVGSYAANGSRISLSLGSNTTCADVVVLERLKTNAGADSSTGVTLFVCTQSMTISSVVMPASGPMPPIETGNVLAPTVGTGVTGTVTALYEVVPFLGPRQPMMVGCLAYFFANLTQDTPITVPVYGTGHVYYPIGNSLTGSLRNAANMSMAILYE